MSKTSLFITAFSMAAIGYNVYTADEQTAIFTEDSRLSVSLDDKLAVDVAMGYAPMTYQFPRTKYERLEDDVKETRYFDDFMREGQCGPRQFINDHYNQMVHVGLHMVYDGLSQSEGKDFLTRHRLSQKSDQHYQLYSLYHNRLDQELCEQGSEEVMALAVTD